MKYVAAIDLGTSKIVGMIAQKEGDELTVLAVERENTVSSVKRGYVHNIGELALKIKRIVKKLENKFGRPIAYIYVNINGQSLRTENNTITYSAKNDEPITRELLEKLRNNAGKKQIPSGEVLEVVDPEYFINGVRELSPIGVFCPQIECRYKLIAGNPLFKKNINRCFSEIGETEIAGYIISPLATAAAVLSEKDKELGCALVEFGAGITSLSVYKGGLLRYLVTIPFGGGNVTHDITCLNVTADYADRLKFEIGNTFNPHSTEKGKKIRLQSADIGGDAPEIDVRKLNECIHARENEIIMNVLNQLNGSGYNDKLGAGIVIAGGASEMNGLTELFKSLTPHEIRKADLMIPIDSARPDILVYPGCEQILGMLWLADKSCVKEPVISEQHPSESNDEKVEKKPVKIQQKQPKNKKGIFDRLSGFGGIVSGFLFEDENSGFNDDNDDDENDNQKK
ncbi:MAG: cell division protein FtsA [Candidatus Azobacteroides sp.]|nr:cell division protein FtsA [Candidatus Azobacteroides sp.]